jgi:hypothetical protein
VVYFKAAKALGLQEPEILPSRHFCQGHRFALRFFGLLSITIFFPPFVRIIFALVALFCLCPSYCLNLFSCSSYNNTPYLNRPMLAVWSVVPMTRRLRKKIPDRPARRI